MFHYGHVNAPKQGRVGRDYSLEKEAVWDLSWTLPPSKSARSLSGLPHYFQELFRIDIAATHDQGAVEVFEPLTLS